MNEVINNLSALVILMGNTSLDVGKTLLAVESNNFVFQNRVQSGLFNQMRKMVIIFQPVL